MKHNMLVPFWLLICTYLYSSKTTPSIFLFILLFYFWIIQMWQTHIIHFPQSTGVFSGTGKRSLSWFMWCRAVASVFSRLDSIQHPKLCSITRRADILTNNLTFFWLSIKHYTGRFRNVSFFTWVLCFIQSFILRSLYFKFTTTIKIIQRMQNWLSPVV